MTLLGRWINLRVPFHEVFGGDRCNLKQAVEKAGLTWQGRAHCGLDDATNTAHLLSLIMHKGFKFSITNSLPFDTGDGSFTWKPTQDKPLYVLPQPQKLQQVRPLVQYHHCCYCGVTSSRGVIRKPGPKQGSLFFGCGNWTAARGARCHYFEWASPWHARSNCSFIPPDSSSLPVTICTKEVLKFGFPVEANILVAGVGIWLLYWVCVDKLCRAVSAVGCSNGYR